MIWNAAGDRCDECLNSRVVVSENGFHSVCCLSEKKAIDCYVGNKNHYIGKERSNENAE